MDEDTSKETSDPQPDAPAVRRSGVLQLGVAGNGDLRWAAVDVIFRPPPMAASVPTTAI